MVFVWQASEIHVIHVVAKGLKPFDKIYSCLPCGRLTQWNAVGVVSVINWQAVHHEPLQAMYTLVEPC